MEIKIHDIENIQQAARQYIEGIKNILEPTSNIPKVIAFYGKMTSPTFAIVNEYEVNENSSRYTLHSSLKKIYHFDFYRIKKIEEVYDMGYEDYFYSGNLCLIEWPELIEDLLPEEALCVTIEEQSDGSRLISC